MSARQVMEFPDDFVWGAATAAYQVEGATEAGGRGPSIWDTFCALPGKIANGDSGIVACDHFHRYREDVELMRQLGLRAYRFSVAWPRVQPDGKQQAVRGLAFYDRLLDELLANDIEPVVTLYHWDLPQALEEQGGWLARDTAVRFADYTALVCERLGDRVDSWVTVNEPFVPAFNGYGNGLHAPGHRDPADGLRAAHHLLLAHGLAMEALRAHARAEHRLGIALNFSPVISDGDGDDHAEAARKFDGLHNRFFLDPLLGQGYPADVLADIAHIGDWQDVIRDGDLDVISAPLDWLGVNYYAPTRTTPLADPAALSNCALPGLRGMDVLPANEPVTSFGWEQAPSALTGLLSWLYEKTGLPLVVAENGAAFEDTVDSDGRVRDHPRIRYLSEHIEAVHDALSAGADVRGYLLWSLLDNFEWAMGFTQRFGIVYVDFATQQRIVKDSGYFYARVIRENSITRQR